VKEPLRWSGGTGRLSQILYGATLAGVTAFADVYCVRDMVRFFRHVKFYDPEPLSSSAVLIISPWLLQMSWGLLRGGYDRRSTFSVWAVMAFGIGLAGIGVLGWVSGRGSQFALYFGACGLCCIGLGVKRALDR
jgi:hypothetical protein